MEINTNTPTPPVVDETTTAAPKKARKVKADVEMVTVNVVGPSAVYVDPFTRKRYKQGDETETELDSWVQSQIDAGIFRAHE